MFRYSGTVIAVFIILHSTVVECKLEPRLKHNVFLNSGYELRGEVQEFKDVKTYENCADTCEKLSCEVFCFQPHCQLSMEKKCLVVEIENDTLFFAKPTPNKAGPKIIPINQMLLSCTIKKSVNILDYLAIGSWEEWTPCPQPCGGAYHKRSRFVSKRMLAEGNDETEVEVCNDQPCDRSRATCNTGFKKLSGVCKPN